MPPPSITTARRTRPPDEVDPTTTPPYDEAAELDLLAAAMSARVGLEVLATTNLEVFYVPRARVLAEALQRAAEHGWRPDTTLVLDELNRSGTLDDVPGGATFVFEVASRNASSASAPRFAAILERHWRARQWLAVAADIVEAANAGQELRILGPITDRIEQITAVATAGPSYTDLAAILAGKIDDHPPTLMARSDGLSLFYSGKLNYLHGEPGKGKSWVAFYAAALALGDEEPVTILDFEDTPRGVAGRLKALGLSDFVIGERCYYIDDPHSKPIRELVRLALAPSPKVIIIDGVAASMTSVDLDEDKASDVNRWMDTLARPLAASGAVVIAVDHVTKSKETRGLWPRGSGAKRARIDGAAYAVEPVIPFTRSQSGYLRLKLAKDRDGFVGGEGDAIALFHVKPINEGKRLEIDLRIPRVSDDEDLGAKTGQGVRGDVTEAILKVLERDANQGPLRRTELLPKLRALPGPGGRGTMTIGNETLSASLEWLADRGKIIRTRDGRASGWNLPPAPPSQGRLEDQDPFADDF